jgi:hypothetical protein
MLQVVPTIGSFSMNPVGGGTNLRLNGSGYVEGATTVNFDSTAVVDPDNGAGTIDVFFSGTALNVLMPVSGGNVTVETAGGVSNAVTVGLIIPPGQQNLSRLPGVTVSASSQFSGSYPPTRGVDGNLSTGWYTANFDPAPSFTINLPSDATVHSLQIHPDLSFPTGFNFITGVFRVFDAADTVLFDSGTVTFTGGNVHVNLSSPVSNARKVVFTGVTWESIEPGFGEFAVVGTAP